MLKLLKKRLFSCPAAFQTTLVQHERSLASAKKRRVAAERPSYRLLRQLVESVEEDFGNDAVECATRLFRELTEEEQSLLRTMREWAAGAVRLADSKAKELIRWLNETVRPGGKWSDTRAIIFTEYRATQNWLHGLMANDGLAANDRLLTIYGGMDTETREQIKAAFQANPAESPVRILLATDAASEGIDLQNHCSRLVHYEIPWNPNRMEQRNGRVDRHGQKADRVLIYHFVGRGYRERGEQAALTPGALEGDLEFLMLAAIKVDRIRNDLGTVGPVIAAQVEEAMLGHRTRLETAAAEKKAEPVRKMLTFERRLREQIQELHDQLQETRRELRLSPDNVQAVVEIALALAGQPPLRDGTLPGVWPDPTGQHLRCPVFRLPAFAGSWAQCLEGLAQPHTGRLRPLVFDHALAAGGVDDGVVGKGCVADCGDGGGDGKDVAHAGFLSSVAFCALRRIIRS